jgi:hypothetical protein
MRGISCHWLFSISWLLALVSVHLTASENILKKFFAAMSQMGGPEAVLLVEDALARHTEAAQAPV